MKKAIYVVMGCLCVCLGVIGAFLPVMPTTIFFILAAYFFARSSDKLYQKLISHPKVGPVVLDWEKHKAMPRSAKIIAVSMTTVGGSFPLFTGISLTGKWIIGLSAFAMLIVLFFIPTRESLGLENQKLEKSDEKPTVL